MKKVLLAVLAVAVLCCGAQGVWAQQQGPAVNIPSLTSKAYSSMKKDEVYVIMFTASYCGPCRVAKKLLLPDLVARYEEARNVHFYTLDVEKDAAAPNGTYLKDNWGIETLPTFVVVYNNTVMLEKTGFAPELKVKYQKALEEAIDRLK